MADTKISALTDGVTAVGTDRIPVARSPFGSTDNSYVTPAYISTYIETLAHSWAETQKIATGKQLHVYNTADQVTNYERFVMKFDTNKAYLTVENGGTGTARQLQISTPSGVLQISDGNSVCTFYSGEFDLPGKSVNVWTATALPAGGTAGRGFKMFSTANFGIFAGSGAPSLSAAKGSIYLRSDGSGTGNRMYVNTDGGTTWTAVTTAA